MNLKRIRLDNNLTQEEFAKQFKVKRATLNNYENENTQPTIEFLCNEADKYNITLDFLCGRKFLDTIGYLNENQKQLVNLIKELNEPNTLKAIGYISGLVAGQ